MRSRIARSACSAALMAGFALTGCAGGKKVMEISATILYERPRITEVSHTLTDHRDEGGMAVLEVSMRGDPGLSATFDIQPGVVSRQPMQETEDGEYVGAFPFPAEAAGGPYTIIVRLRHEDAGEVTLRDPDLVTIPLSDYSSREP